MRWTLLLFILSILATYADEVYIKRFQLPHSLKQRGWSRSFSGSYAAFQYIHCTALCQVSVSQSLLPLPADAPSSPSLPPSRKAGSQCVTPHAVCGLTCTLSERGSKQQTQGKEDPQTLSTQSPLSSRSQGVHISSRSCECYCQVPKVGTSCVWVYLRRVQ